MTTNREIKIAYLTFGCYYFDMIFLRLLVLLIVSIVHDINI